MSRSFRLLTLALAIMASALLLAGCGGVSKKEYEKDVNKVMKSVDEGNFNSSDPKAANLKDASKDIEKAADDLDDITPPDDVKDLHNDLVEGVRELGDLLGDIAPILTDIEKDPASAAEHADDMTDIQGRMEKTQAKLEKTIKAFEKKGYDTKG